MEVGNAVSRLHQASPHGGPSDCSVTEKFVRLDDSHFIIFPTVGATDSGCYFSVTISSFTQFTHQIMCLPCATSISHGMVVKECLNTDAETLRENQKMGCLKN